MSHPCDPANHQRNYNSLYTTSHITTTAEQNESINSGGLAHSTAGKVHFPEYTENRLRQYTQVLIGLVIPAGSVVKLSPGGRVELTRL